MLCLVAAVPGVLTVGDTGRGRGGILGGNSGRAEASQAQGCFAGRREALTSWLDADSERMPGEPGRAGHGVLSKGRDEPPFPQALGQRCIDQYELG